MWRPPGIFRERVLDLPCGTVHEVEVHLEDGLVSELRLHIDDRVVLLVVGEVHPTMEGDPVFVRGDQSVLVFADPDVADTVVWRPPRSVGG